MACFFSTNFPNSSAQPSRCLRQPLEDRKVTVSRAAGTVTFPANVMLVAAMNPCACGYFGDPKRECRCSPKQVENYRNRISGPLLDRIDIHVEAPAVEYKELSSDERAESSEAIRERVLRARKLQQRTLCRKTKMPRQCPDVARPAQRPIANWTPRAGNSCGSAMEELHLSARAYDRILKVARTIADLAGERGHPASSCLGSNPIPDAGQEFVALRSTDKSSSCSIFKSSTHCAWNRCPFNHSAMSERCGRDTIH